MLNASLDDIMCEHPVRVTEDIAVGAVAHLLFRYRINGILVVKKRNKKHLCGIFTTTDLLRLLDNALSQKTKRLEALEKIAKMRVGKVASKQIVSFQKDTKLTKVVAMMHRRNVHTIPVFDKDCLVGVVGRHDLLNMAFS